eukprot:COSAG01_NODE_29748_length_630_cov_1.517891_2_plen_64_part_01
MPCISALSSATLLSNSMAPTKAGCCGSNLTGLVPAARKGLDDTRRLVLTGTLVAQATLRVDLTS